LEYTGEAIRNLSMEGRMTICNMSIEAGARAGLISPDDTTVEFLRGKRHVPEGEAFDKLAQEWKELATDEGAIYDEQVEINADEIEPQVTWGTNPGMCIPVSADVPTPEHGESDTDREEITRALEYMGLEGGEPISTVSIEHVFIGSCTN